MLANHTNIRTLLDEICRHFHKMFKSKAFLHNFEATQVMNRNAEKEFTDSVGVIQEVIGEYAAAEKENFGAFE
jgi:hypothetical protein